MPGSHQVVCSQCDKPEESCVCEKYCTICKGQSNIRVQTGSDLLAESPVMCSKARQSGRKGRTRRCHSRRGGFPKRLIFEQTESLVFPGNRACQYELMR